MDPFRILLQLCACDDAAQTFRVFAKAFADSVPTRCALRVRVEDSAVLDAVPSGTVVSPELLGAAAHVLRPEIFPLKSQLPHEAEAYPGCEALLLPLRAGGAEETLVVIFEEGALGEDVTVWEELAGGIGRIRTRARRLAESDRERQELRRRAEESEALHTLGLAANRTLDQDEVLSLVARFTRTLLGAHYATVHTRGGETIHLVASVGLPTGDRSGADGQNELARRVIEAEKPLIVGGSSGEPVAASAAGAVEGTRAALGIPLSLYGDTFGALVVGYRREYDVTPADVRLAITLAGHAAVAINNAHLHQEVESHAAELDRANRKLHEATRAKERFFNAISHDLRTPVGAIKGYMELILDGMTGELSAQAEKYVRSTHRASETLLALVDDILDFAKLDSGKLELSLGDWALGELLEDALAAVRPQAQAKALRLSAPDPAGLPTLRTDGKRLRQILVNLLSNAVKFTDRGGVSVEVGSLDGAEPRLLIRVIDEGRGIATTEQARVFEEFEQISGSHGTGLGLPISRKLAHLLGGDLTLESEPGHGSTFTLTLPLPPVEADGDRPPGADRPRRTRDTQHAG